MLNLDVSTLNLSQSYFKKMIGYFPERAFPEAEVVSGAEEEQCEPIIALACRSRQIADEEHFAHGRLFCKLMKYVK